MGTIIGIITEKGGVGKTQTAYELGTVLAEQGNKVICIDMDGQINLTTRMGIAEDRKMKTIMDCLSIDVEADLDEIEEVLGKATRKCSKMDLICGSTKMARADRIFVEKDDVFLLRNFCDAFLRDEYDYIIIDTPPARNVISDMTIIAADYAILISDGSEDARRGIEHVFDNIDDYKNSEMHRWSHINVLGIVMNRFKGNTCHFTVELETYKEKVKEEIERRNLGKDPFFETVREAVEAYEAGSNSMSCQEYNHYGNVARDFRKVAAEALKRIAAQNE